MAKYHITAKGEPGACRATTRPCPLGGEDEHYPTKRAAVNAYEAKQANELFQSVRKSMNYDTGEQRIVNTAKGLVRLSTPSLDVEDFEDMTFADVEDLVTHEYSAGVMEAIRSDQFSPRTLKLAMTADPPLVARVQELIDSKKAAWREDPDVDKVWGLVKLDGEGRITNDALLVSYESDNDFEEAVDLWEV